jgi:hypothetical membrane protein
MLKANTKRQWLIWWGGFCGIVGSVLAIVMILVASMLSPWFRWETNALSELGVGEVSLLFNCAVIFGGIFNFIFAVGIREYFPRGRLIKIGVVLIMLSAVCLALVGVFTISYPILHFIVALGEFILAPVGIILIGYSLRDSGFGKLSIVLGIAALTTILLLSQLLLVLQINVGFAVPEMIEALIVVSWIDLVGSQLLRSKRVS